MAHWSMMEMEHSEFLLGPKAPSHKMQSVFFLSFFWVSSFLLARGDHVLAKL